MAEEHTLFETRGAVGVFTFNRPEKLNALTNAMLDGLLKAIERASFEESIRALVLRGTGRAFCAGDDLSGMGPFPRPVPPGHVVQADLQHEAVAGLRGLQKPVIAALHGYCLGMGNDLALACDLRIAAEGTKIGEPRVTRGMHITTGSTYLLPRVVGLAKAIELLILGEPVDAGEALRIGLVHRVVPAERLDEETMALASRLAEGATRAIGVLKSQVYTPSST